MVYKGLHQSFWSPFSLSSVITSNKAINQWASPSFLPLYYIISSRRAGYPPAYQISATLYTYITSPYHSVIFPNGYTEAPDWDHYRTLSSLLALTPNHLHSPIGAEVIQFIHGSHQFEARLYPDAPVDFVIVIDINPVNLLHSLTSPNQLGRKPPPTTSVGISSLVPFPITSTRP